MPDEIPGPSEADNQLDPATIYRRLWQHPGVDADLAEGIVRRWAAAEKALASAAADRGRVEELRWTSEPPTVTGWYWWRFGPGDFDPWVERWEWHDDGILRTTLKDGIHESGEGILTRLPGSQWAGPIPEPGR